MTTLSSRVMAHPYQALFVALGVGYILGGGLFTRLTLGAIRTGIHMGALPLVRRALFDAAEVALRAAPPRHTFPPDAVMNHVS